MAGVSRIGLNDPQLAGVRAGLHEASGDDWELEADAIRHLTATAVGHYWLRAPVCSGSKLRPNNTFGN